MRTLALLHCFILLFRIAHGTAVESLGSYEHGLQYDPSCAPYRSHLDKVAKSVRQMAIAGYNAAGVPEAPYFTTWFEKGQEDFVRLAMKNIARCIDGHGPPIILKCTMNEICPNARGYASHGFPNVSDYVNLCEHILVGGGGSWARPWVPDWCSTGERMESVAEVLLHELTHMPVLVDNLFIWDPAYDREGSLRLAKGEFFDANGTKVLATENANNYVQFAGHFLWHWSRNNPQVCPDVGQDELRKLLQAGYSDDGFDEGLGETGPADGNGRRKIMSTDGPSAFLIVD